MDLLLFPSILSRFFLSLIFHESFTHSSSAQSLNSCHTFHHPKRAFPSTTIKAQLYATITYVCGADFLCRSLFGGDNYRYGDQNFRSHAWGPALSALLRGQLFKSKWRKRREWGKREEERVCVRGQVELTDWIPKKKRTSSWAVACLKIFSGEIFTLSFTLSHSHTHIHINNEKNRGKSD